MGKEIPAFTFALLSMKISVLWTSSFPHKRRENKILVPGTGASNVFLSDMLGTGELYF